jgi:hypothetical protein
VYYVSYRGLGLLGFVPPVVGMAGLAAMMERTFTAAALTAGVCIGVSGLALAAADRLVRKEGHRNSLYGIPLWAWGVLWALLGAALAGYMGYQAATVGWKN